MAGEIFTSILHILFEWPGPVLRILGVALIAAFVLICIAGIAHRMRMWWDVRARGWTVDDRGRDTIVYRETVEGHLEDLGLDSQGFRGEYIVYVPSEPVWDRTVPAWARGRRSEIVERIRSRLQPPAYEFEYR
jgi:hypothetical protein